MQLLVLLCLLIVSLRVLLLLMLPAKCCLSKFSQAMFGLLLFYPLMTLGGSDRRLLMRPIGSGWRYGMANGLWIRHLVLWFLHLIWILTKLTLAGRKVPCLLHDGGRSLYC